MTKSMYVLLMDNEVGGRVECEIADTSYVIYTIPRTKIELCKEMDALQRSGVYFLLGYDQALMDYVCYVGQSDCLYRRLQQHDKDAKEYDWQNIVVLACTNNSLNVADISYLEHHFYKLARKAEHYNVKNSIVPRDGNITKHRKYSLDNTILTVRMALVALGYPMLEPAAHPIKRQVKSVSVPPAAIESLPSINPVLANNEDNAPIFYMKTPSYDATCVQTNAGYVLKAGSRISKILTNSASIYDRKSREDYQDKLNSDMVVKEDILFRSASGAAKFVSGSIVSGFNVWKTAEGKTLKELQEGN